MAVALAVRVPAPEAREQAPATHAGPQGILVGALLESLRMLSETVEQ